MVKYNCLWFGTARRPFYFELPDNAARCQKLPYEYRTESMGKLPDKSFDERN